MLRVYRRQDDHLVPTELEVAPDSQCTAAAGALWLDLVMPTRPESLYVNRLLGIAIPSSVRRDRRWVAAHIGRRHDNRRA